MNPFLTCSSLPHPLHRSAIRSPHRQPHRRWIWAIYAALKPSILASRAIGPGSWPVLYSSINKIPGCSSNFILYNVIIDCLMSSVWDSDKEFGNAVVTAAFTDTDKSIRRECLALLDYSKS